jgi:hypothetical protein
VNRNQKQETNSNYKSNNRDENNFIGDDSNKIKCFCYCHFNNTDSIDSLTRANSISTDFDSNSSFFSVKSELGCNQCDSCFLMDNQNNDNTDLKSSSSISTSSPPTSMRSSSSSSSLLLTSTIQNENYKVIHLKIKLIF